MLCAILGSNQRENFRADAKRSQFSRGHWGRARYCAQQKRPPRRGGLAVRDTGIEPVTSSVSGKRATAAPIAPIQAYEIVSEVATGFEPVYTALQAAASPLGHATAVVVDTTSGRENSATRADDETRTRDPHLGKVMRYQLRYIRIAALLRFRCRGDLNNYMRVPGATQISLERPGAPPVSASFSPRVHAVCAPWCNIPRQLRSNVHPCGPDPD